MNWSKIGSVQGGVKVYVSLTPMALHVTSLVCIRAAVITCTLTMTILAQGALHLLTLLYHSFVIGGKVASLITIRDTTATRILPGTVWRVLWI